MTYLSLCEVEGDGDLVPPEPRQVVVVAELALQVRDLALLIGCNVDQRR